MKTLFVLLLLVGCDNPFGLSDVNVPPNAVAYEPNAVIYLRWWNEVQADSGLSGRVDRIQWFEVKGGPWFSEGYQKTITGLWKSDGHRIYLAEGFTTRRGAVKHEMLHDLIGGDGDPGHANPLFFVYSGQ